MTSEDISSYLDQLFEQCLSLLENPEAINEVIDKLHLLIKVNSDHAPAHYLLGLAYFLKDDIDEAIRPWKKAINLKYKEKESHLSLSIIYFKKRNLKEVSYHINELKSYAVIDSLHKNLYDLLLKYERDKVTDENQIINDLIKEYKEVVVKNLYEEKDIPNVLKSSRLLKYCGVIKIKEFVMNTIKGNDYFNYLIIIIVLLLILRKLLVPGIPDGLDMYAHIFWVWNFWESFQKLSYPIWSVHWYGGYPMMLTYPPISHIVAALISLMTNNYILGIKITIVLSFLLGALGMYLISMEYGQDKKAALVSALAYPLSYHFIYHVTLRGSLSNCVALGVLPLFFLFTVRYYKTLILNESEKMIYVYLVLSSFSLMVVFLSHYSIGVIAIMIFSLYVCYYVLYDIIIKRSNSVITYTLSYIVILILFLLFTSFWSIPMISYVKYSGTATELLFNVRSTALFTDWIANLPLLIPTLVTRKFGWYEWYVGASLFFLGVISSISVIKKYPENFLSILFLFSLYSVSGGLPLIADLFGVNLSFLLSPFRLMAILVFILSVLASHFVNGVFLFVKKIVKSEIRYKLICIIITILTITTIYLDFSPSFQYFRTTTIAESLLQEFQWLEAQDGLFRVYSHGVYEIQGSMERFGPVIHRKELLHGNDERSLTYETFRNVEEINWMVKNAGKDPVLAERLIDGLIRKFRFSNVKYFVVGPGIRDVVPILTNSPLFIRHKISNSMDIFEMHESTSPVRKISRVLIIGDESNIPIIHNLFFYSPLEFVYDVESNYDNINIQQLSKYDLIVIYGISTERIFERIEPTVIQYLLLGGTALIDPSMMKEKISFLDVTCSPTSIQDDITVTVNPTYSEVFPDQPYNFSKAEWNGTPWSFHTYQGLDEEISKGNEYTLLGYRQIGDGQAYFLGMNLFYHIEYTKNEHERQFLNRILEYVLEIGQVIITDIERSPGKLNFIANVSSPSVNILVSESFFPGWKVLDNTQEMEIEQTREGWIIITSHSGVHNVSFERIMTLPYKIGFTLTLITIGLVLYIYFRVYFHS